MTPQMLCNTCKFYLGSGKCKAFNKIPFMVLSGINKHENHILGQIGKYTFEKTK